MKISIKTKFFFGFLLIIIFALIIGTINLIQERQAWEDNFISQAITLGHALNASIGSEEAFQNKTLLQNSIYKLIWLNPDIIRANINHLTAEGLETIASNITGDIGKPASDLNFTVLQTGETLIEEIEIRGEKALLIASPIYIAGKTMGTYEIAVSLQMLEKTIRDRFFRFMTILIATLLFLALAGLFMFSLLILRPIKKLNRAIEEFGGGNLGYRIKKYPGDEIGDVARGFNDMSQSLEKKYNQLKELNQQLVNSYQLAEKKVKERTKELEAAKASLEEKVKERTKELEKLKSGLEEQVKIRTKELQEKTDQLQQNIEELEKFHTIATGRELKMVELKEEINKLKEKLTKKN